MVERLVRRLWFQKLETEPWSQFGFNTIQFGDHPAVAIMSIVVERVAQNHMEVAAELKLPAALVQADSNKLLRDTYVDDGTTRGCPGDISRQTASSLGPFLLSP